MIELAYLKILCFADNFEHKCLSKKIGRYFCVTFVPKACLDKFSSIVRLKQPDIILLISSGL